MERLTERNKHGVAVMRQDLPRTPEDNLVTRLAAYEDSGIDPEMVAVIGWIGQPVFVPCRMFVCGIGADLKVHEGRVAGVYFGGYITQDDRVKVEVMFGSTTSSFDPEDVFLTREDADAALAEIAEWEAGQ